MRETKKAKIKFAIRILLLILVADIVFGSVAWLLCESYIENCREDVGRLRNAIAEAYININKDPMFINTATDDQPMEIPEKYYTAHESFRGDGAMHMVVYADGDVRGYYGKPERDLHYYMYGDSGIKHHNLVFPFILNALFHLTSHLHLIPLLVVCGAIVVVMMLCWFIRHRKRKIFDATIAAIQADSNLDEVSRFE